MHKGGGGGGEGEDSNAVTWKFEFFARKIVTEK